MLLRFSGFDECFWLREFQIFGVFRCVGLRDGRVGGYLGSFFKVFFATFSFCLRVDILLCILMPGSLGFSDGLGARVWGGVSRALIRYLAVLWLKSGFFVGVGFSGWGVSDVRLFGAREDGVWWI